MIRCVLTATLLCVCLLGCGQTPIVRSTTFSAQVPRPANATVDVFPGHPARRYVAIGEVFVSGPPTFLDPPPEPAVCLDALRVRAREMGGDAVINYDGRRGHAGTTGAYIYTGQGTVVKWAE